MLAAGDLNSAITIERWDPAAGVDEYKQAVPGWMTAARTRASIRHASGLEVVRGGAETSMVKASIRIRYRKGIDASMRVVHGQVVYRIVAVLPDEARREYVDLVCERSDAVV